MALPFTINDVEADPDFRKKTFAEQNDIRARYFRDIVAPDPEFANFDQEGQQEIARQILQRGPVFEDDADDHVIAARQRANAILAGDLETRNAVKNDLFLRGSTKNSVVGNILVGAYDVVSELWDQGDPVYRYTYGRESSKIDAIEMKALEATEQTPGEVKSFQSGVSVASGAVQLAEAFATQGALVGTLGKAGLLTGSAMTKVASAAASMKGSSLLQRALASAGEQTVQALVGGAISTAESVLMEGAHSGGFADTNLKTLASQVGSNLALDYGMWMGMSAASVAARFIGLLPKTGTAKAAWTAFRDLPPEEVERALASSLLKTGTIDPALKAQLSPKFLSGLEDELDRLRKTANASLLRSKEDVARVVAAKCGVSFSIDDAGVNAFDIVSGAPLGTYKNLESLTAGVLKGMAPAAKSFKLADAVSTIRARDEFEIDRIPPTERAALYGRLLESGDKDNIALAVSRMTGLETVEVPDLFGQNAALRGKPAADLENAKALWIDRPKLLQNFKDYRQNGKVPVPAEGFANTTQLQSYVMMLKNVEGFGDLIDPETSRIVGGMAWGHSSKNSLASMLGRATSKADFEIASKIWTGSTVEPLAGGAFRVSRAAPDGTREVVLTAQNAAELRAKLVQEAVVNGHVTPQDISAGVLDLTGYKLTRAEHTIRGADGKETVVPVWTLSTPLGPKKNAVVDRAEDLGDLLIRHPTINSGLKYPASMAPKVYVVDPEAGRVAYEGAVASGRLVDLMSISDQYMTPLTGRMGERNRIKLAVGADGYPLYFDEMKRKFIYTSYSGATIERSSVESLQAAIAKRVATTDEVRLGANARGFSLLTGPDGTVHLVDDSQDLTFRSRAELHQFFEKTPVIETAPELVETAGWGPEQIDAIQTELENLRKTTLKTPKKGEDVPFWTRVTHPTTWLQYAGPTESSFSAMALKTGDRKMYDAWRGVSDAKRLLNVSNREIVPYIERLASGYSILERERIGELLKVVPEKRAAFCKSVFGVDLTAKDVSRIREVERFREIFLKENGLEELNSLVARPLEVIQKIKEAEKSPGLPPTAMDILEGVYKDGSVPRALMTFAGGLSAQDLQSFLETKDFAAQFTSMIDRVHKVRYFKPLMPQLADAFVSTYKKYLDGEVPESHLRFFCDTLDEAYGIRTPAAVALSERWSAWTDTLADFLDRSKTLKNLGVPPEVRTSDIVGKLGEVFTLNSQAWRIWAIPRNLTQITLLGSVIGNGRAWKALDYCLDHREYLDSLYASGALEESIAAMGDVTLSPIRKAMKLGLHPMELSDALTRGACMKAAEDQVAYVQKRLTSGLVSSTKLLDELQADFLEPLQQEKILELFKSGNLKATSDFLGNAWQSATMFDYQKGGTGYVTRGLIGRVFGKLGVYPLQQIDLYRKIIANGSPAARADRAARLIGTTTALWAACKAVGISYDGFLATDPFAFSGGPYWSMMNDALNSIGTGPESSLARSRLKRNVPRALVPGMMFESYLGKAADAWDKGDYWRLFLALSTAPALKQNSAWNDARASSH